MTNALEIKNLTKNYKGFNLDNVSLTLPGGCIMGLIGENGAGKSTIIRLILGMLRRNGGSVSILGRDNEADMRRVKEDIGVVPDEIGIPEFFRVKEINSVMRLTFKNWDEAEFFRLVDSLSIPRDKTFAHFSRGMKMKTGIAIALSHKPKLLILDEATNGLDPVVRDEVVEMLRNFACDEEHSILISSHIVSDLEKLCDYVAFLHKGQLLLCEEKDALLSRYAIVRASASEIERIDSGAVLRKKISPYGAEAVALRSAVPGDMKIIPISLEELFVFMVKEAA